MYYINLFLEGRVTRGQAINGYSCTVSVVKYYNIDYVHCSSIELLSMKNCNTFNVYYLKPAKFCDSAYCVQLSKCSLVIYCILFLN